MEATDVKVGMLVKFRADDGRVLTGEVMRAIGVDAPDGHFPIVVNWSTWYVTPDVILRAVGTRNWFKDVKEAHNAE